MIKSLRIFLSPLKKTLLVMSVLFAWGGIGFFMGRSLPPEIRTVEVPVLSLDAPRYIAISRPEPNPLNGVNAVINEDLVCMAANIYHEARGERTERGKGMVGQAFMNRVGKPGYADSVCGVIHQHKQASWVLDKPYVDLGNPVDRVSYIESFRIAQDVLDGKYELAAQGAFMYYNPYKVNPYWADDYQEVALVGSHRFMK